MTKVYCYDRCSTCKKALAWLSANASKKQNGLMNLGSFFCSLFSKHSACCKEYVFACNVQNIYIFPPPSISK